MDWLDDIRLWLPSQWWKMYISDTRHLVSTEPPKHIQIAHDFVRKHPAPRIAICRPVRGPSRPELFGYADSVSDGLFLDAPLGVVVGHRFTDEPDWAYRDWDMVVGLWPLGDRLLGVMQVQNLREHGNRWAFRLRGGDRRSHVLDALARVLPGWSFATPDGQQKVDYLLYLHGGFTEEELRAMEWAEWPDGEQVLPRCRKQYDRCPDGYIWGEAVNVHGADIWARKLVPQK